MARCAFAALLLSVLTGLVCACGGGGGGKDPASLSLGLVSATEPTTAVVEFTNPFDASAFVAVQGTASPFQVVPGSLPSTPVGPGETLEASVEFSPTGSGEVNAAATLRFQAGTSTATVSKAMHAIVEEVLVRHFPPGPAFGAVAFGESVTRSFPVLNASSVSDVTFTQASFPNGDFVLESPALPLVLRAGEQRTLEVRYRPYESLGVVVGDVVLRPASVQGTARIPLSATGTAGTAIFEMSVPLEDGSSGALEIDVPAHVFSLTIEAEDPGVTLEEAGYDEFLRGFLPPPGARRLDLTSLVGPGERNYTANSQNMPAVITVTIPNSDHPDHQLVQGGGTYRFELELSNPPTSAALDVRVILRANATGSTPSTATLDLNIWLGSSTTLTAATAGSDAVLQAALAQTAQTLALGGISLGDIAYFDWDEPSSFSVADLVGATAPTIPSLTSGAPKAINLFLYHGMAGLAPAPGGPTRHETIQSFTFAGSQLGWGWVIPHEILHYLGLLHVIEDSIVDTPAGGPNVMDIGAIGGGGVTAGQGFVARNHPILRYP